MANLRAIRIDVQKKLAEIEPLSPSGYCYIVSKHSTERQMVAGVLNEVTLPLAARFIVEGTHDLASEEQVAEYRAKQAEIRAQIEAAGKRHLDRELRVSVNR